MNIRVLIADDHPVVRAGLVSILTATPGSGVELAGEAAGGRELLELAGRVHADVYVLDIAMPGLDGLEACALLRRRHPAARVLFLSMYDGSAFVQKALAAGARGFVSKESAAADLVRAVREVHAGGTFLSEGCAGGSAGVPASARRYGLTRRETEVLRLLVEGYVLKEIAQRLKTSLHTVQNQRSALMRKLKVHRQADLVKFALREGLAAP